VVINRLLWKGPWQLAVTVTRKLPDKYLNSLQVNGTKLSDQTDRVDLLIFCATCCALWLWPRFLFPFYLYNSSTHSAPIITSWLLAVLCVSLLSVILAIYSSALPMLADFQHSSYSLLLWLYPLCFHTCLIHNFNSFHLNFMSPKCLPFCKNILQLKYSWFWGTSDLLHA